MRNLLLALLLLTLPAAACLAHQPDPLAGSEWLVVSIGELKAGPEVTLRFHSQGKVGGQAGVNAFGGTYTVADGGLSFGLLMMTRMAGPAEFMEQEARLMEVLERVDGFQRDGIHLKLMDDGNVVMELRQTDWD
jgi:heat shock protein HslJ